MRGEPSELTPAGSQGHVIVQTPVPDRVSATGTAFMNEALCR